MQILRVKPINNIATRNNYIFMEFEILGKRQKVIAKEHGLAEKTVKLIICKIRKTQNAKRL